jgi:2,4-dienoyl-CoA reductase-like NADH-dependent reductase (Old Yellow Enzyme family)/thioredoxin reductase
MNCKDRSVIVSGDSQTKRGKVSMEQEFKNLFTPLQVGSLSIPNRIFMSGAGVRLYPETGAPNERAIHYYQARAKGGAGLVVAPCFTFSLTTAMIPTACQSGEATPAFRSLADAVHQYDTKIFMQITNPGSFFPGRAMGGGSAWGPSPVWRPAFFTPGLQEIAHEMEVEDIHNAVESYARAASLAQEAGFDGVEIAAITGLLLSQFMSPAYNIRTDEYGGSLENRLRFLLEIVSAARDAVGPGFVVGVRFTGDDFIDHMWWTKNSGLTLDDGKEIAKRLEATGKLDYLFPCSGGYGPTHVAPMYYPLGCFAYLGAAIKEVVSLPVFTISRINDPVIAEKILSDNQADMVGMLRGLIADPELPNKARQGKLDEIRRCIGCNEGCTGNYYPRLPLLCAVNPEAGREKEFAITPAKTRKRVMVIGAGAAGLETARVAALRGHQVSLYEKEDTLANELSIAGKVPGRQDFEEIRRYYAYQMKLHGVDVHLGAAVTPDMVIQENPDVAVVATGARPFIPEVDGSHTGHVIELREVLQEKAEVGQHVVVADYQNHMYGLDAADFLSERGKKVELVTESVYAGGMVDYHTLWVAYTRVLSKGVVVTPLTRIKEIRGKTVVVINVLTNAERLINGIDSVVFCTDGRADDALYRALKGKVKELYLVGRALSPRRLLDSVADGHVAANKM